MAAKCIVCRDPRRADIDKALSGPRAILATSRKYKYSRDTLKRHQAHMPPVVALELPAEPGTDEIPRLKAQVQRIIDETDDEKVRIAALRELRGYLELEIRVQQETGASSALTADPAFQKLAAVLANTICADCRANIGVLTADAISVATLAARATAQEPIGAAPLADPTPGVPAPDAEGGVAGSPSPESPVF